MKTGLVSVTFRKYSPERIIELVKQAELDGIEWGGDIHVPAGDTDTARRIAHQMRSARLETISYGSYYRAGDEENFEAVLRTAEALGTQNIRIWAGSGGSRDVSAKERARIVSNVQRAAAAAKPYGITLSFEYHGETLTDTQASAVQLLDEVGMENVYIYWQPLRNTDHSQNIKNIQELSRKNKLMNIHAYHWVGDDVLYLQDGFSFWREYLQNAAAHAVLLEFVKDDCTESFLRDAKTLKELVE